MRHLQLLKKHQAFKYSSKIIFISKVYRKSLIELFSQLCDVGFLSLLLTESCETQLETTTSPSHSDMIDTGLTNFSAFLKYIRKHTDRLTIHAGRKFLRIHPGKLISMFSFSLVDLIQQSHERCLEHFNDSVFDMAR